MSLSISISISISIYIYVYLYLYIYLYLCLYLCPYLYLYLCLSMLWSVYVYVYVYMYICVCICICICIYVYVYVYVYVLCISINYNYTIYTYVSNLDLLYREHSIASTLYPIHFSTTQMIELAAFPCVEPANHRSRCDNLRAVQLAQLYCEPSVIAGDILIKITLSRTSGTTPHRGKGDERQQKLYCEQHPPPPHIGAKMTNVHI